MTEFSVENPTKIMEIESFLANNAYLSGQPLPGAEDAKVLGLITETPDRTKYPNLFAWWWNLCPFQESARALWGNTKQKGGKKDEKKPAEKKEENKDGDDEIDLFGEDNEEDVKKLQEKITKDKKQAEKEANQKSRIVMDIKGHEVGQDFQDLGKRIMTEITKEGLHWENNLQVLPLAFGMNKLQMCFVVVNRLASADWVEEQIYEKYAEEVQSVDIVDFQTA